MMHNVNLILFNEYNHTPDVTHRVYESSEDPCITESVKKRPSMYHASS